MAKSLNALGKLNKVLNVGPQQPLQPKDTGYSQQWTVQSPYPTPTSSALGGVGLFGTSPSLPSTTGPSACGSTLGDLAMPAYAPAADLEAEDCSPGSDGVGVLAGLNVVTPELSTNSGSEWNYGNMIERAAEFVSPALCG